MPLDFLVVAMMLLNIGVELLQSQWDDTQAFRTYARTHLPKTSNHTWVIHS